MSKATSLSSPEIQSYMADMCEQLALLARSHEMEEVARYLTLAQRLIAIEMRENAPSANCASAA